MPRLDTAQHEFAIYHYANAVTRVQRIIGDAGGDLKPADVETVLLATLMFMTFELLQGSYELAFMHRATGLKILSTLVDSTAKTDERRVRVRVVPVPRTAIEVLSQSFICLDYSAATRKGFVNLEAVTLGDGGKLGSSFSSLDEARMHLLALMNAVYRVRSDLEAIAKEELCGIKIDSEDPYLRHCWTQTRAMMVDLEGHLVLQKSLGQIEAQISAWSSAFTSMSATSDSTEDAIRMMMQVQFMSAWLWSSIWRGASEMTCDRFLPVFRATLQLIEKLLTIRPDPDRPDLDMKSCGMSLWRRIGGGSGIIEALFVVGAKCRDGSVRREATLLLKTLRLQEGLLPAPVLGHCLEEVVGLEEQRARNIIGHSEGRSLRCEDVPEQARFLDVNFHTDPADKGRLVLTASVKSLSWPGFIVEQHLCCGVVQPHG